MENHIINKMNSMKNEIRKNILQARKKLSEEEREVFSRTISSKVTALFQYQNAEWIFCFIDAKGEIQTKYIIEDAWNQGKKVAVPRVCGKEMLFYKITSYDELEPGVFGLLEPKTTCPVVEPTNDAKTIVIMPGVAFGKTGNRIGYGGGYYDKYFARYPNVYKIAPVFSCQIISDVPHEEHDIKADFIVTEKESI